MAALCICRPRSDWSGNAVRISCRRPHVPVLRYTKDGDDCDALIDVRGIVQCGFRDIQITDLPALLRPQKGRLGLVDYEKAFCADLISGNDVYDMRNINRDTGCIVIVRPDQYVANILPLTRKTISPPFLMAYSSELSRPAKLASV